MPEAPDHKLGGSGPVHRRLVPKMALVDVEELLVAGRELFKTLQSALVY